MGEHLNGANEGRVNCAVRKEMSMGLREAQGFLEPLSLEAVIPSAQMPFNYRLSHRLQ